MPSESNMLLCYNKGCGKTFDPALNLPDSCRHHSGVPVFHDAYKSWTCCKKKSIDFTEFLNIPGCTVSCHSNEKPPEPERQVEESNKDEVIEYRAPESVRMERSSFDTPLTDLKYEVSEGLKKDLQSIKANTKSDQDVVLTTIPLGESCKNNSCKATYEGEKSLKEKCLYHPGCPVFHEGLKYWSCCSKKTTDFNVFLELVGCQSGQHVWFKSKKKGEGATCRLDWHQTGSHVFITVFGKKSDPSTSSIQLSPVRLKMSLYFPDQEDSYVSDIHLYGVVSVEESCVFYYSTKVEIKLSKAELVTWAKLEYGKIGSSEKTEIPQLAKKTNKLEILKEDSDDDSPDSVDLSCI